MKNNFSTKLFFAICMALIPFFSSCNKDSENNGNAKGNGECYVDGKSIQYQYAYISKGSDNEYTIYLSSEDMLALTSQLTADHSIFLEDASIYLRTANGELPNGTYRFTRQPQENSWNQLEICGYYWFNAWEEEPDDITGDREEYYYSMSNNNADSSITINLSGNQLKIEIAKANVFRDEDGSDGVQTPETVTHDATLLYNGEVLVMN